MDHYRQQRAQQELRIVSFWVHQHDGLRHQRPDERSLRCCARRSARHRGREAVAQPGRCDAGGGEELLVIEGDDLRALPGSEVVFEIGRDVERRDGVAGANRARRCRQIGPAFDDREIGRRRHPLNEGARGFRAVLIDHHGAEVADHRPAEGGRQCYEGEQRHAEDQDECCAVAPQPAQLAPGDQQKSGLGRPSHWRVRQST